MATILFKNNATSTLAGSISNVATTAQLATGSGALFPSPSGGDFFCLTFNDAATGLLNEIVHVTNVSGDTLTIVRGQEGTVALAWNAGDLASNLWTAGSAQAMLQQGQNQAQGSNYSADSGTANAMVATLSPVPASLAAMNGAPIRISKAASANTGAVTLNLNGLGAVAVTDGAGGPLTAGMLPASSMVEVAYSTALSTFVLLSRAQNANQTMSGVTNFPNGASVDNNGVATFHQIQSEAPAVLNPANSTLTIENLTGNAAAFMYTGSTSLICAQSCQIKSTAPNLIGFFYGNSLVNVGNITTTGTTTAYGTTSDESFKDFKGVMDPADAIAIIRADPVRRFEWLPHFGSGAAVGWGAQTSYAVSEDLARPGGWVVPAVMSAEEWEDAVLDENGNEVTPRRLVKAAEEIEPGRLVDQEGPDTTGYQPWSVDQSKRTPYLWAAVAGILDKLDAITARLDALEAKKP